MWNQSGVSSSEEMNRCEELSIGLHPKLPIWKKALYLGAASFFFGLGLIGVIVPGLPTTPFLLLTSFFLVRSAPKLNSMLLRSRLFGPLLTDWQVHGGVRMNVRISAIALVVVAISFAAFTLADSFWLSAMVISFGASGIVTIIMLPAAREIDGEENTILELVNHQDRVA